LLSVLPESHVARDLSEALPTQEDVVLADESLLAPAPSTLVSVTSPLRGVLTGHVAFVP
jgi:hypothetical protein